MKTAWNKYLELKKGVTAQSEFWMLKKEAAGMDQAELLRNPIKEEVEIAVKTINRMRSSGDVFRSIDIINGMQTELKGVNGDKNVLKMVEFINFMSQGDI